MKSENHDEEVLQLLAEGYSEAEMAEKLHVAVSTVKNWKRRVMVNLGARSSAHAIALWMTAKMPPPVPPEEYVVLGSATVEPGASEVVIRLRRKHPE